VTDRYREALEHVRATLERSDGLDDVVGLLHERFPEFSWIGFYRVEGDELVLGPWRGPRVTEHVRIRVGEGICGAAAATGRTELVEDVEADPRYLACFPSTRSEIVVPVIGNGRVIGEIDVDSDTPSAFDERDRRLLEAVAALIADAVPAPGAGWLVDEWGRESFPASDPPACWAGRDRAVVDRS
jgi:putative methionine-R-sulfoxide reductase with GAF domain